MALVCNIDQRGRQARYRIGFVLLGLGLLVALVGGQLVGGSVPWVVAGGLAAGGAFALFEANRGWCAARALGIKTKI